MQGLDTFFNKNIKKKKNNEHKEKNEKEKHVAIRSVNYVLNHSLNRLRI